MKPRLKMVNWRKSRAKMPKRGKMPKLIRIGCSVGLIISKAMLRNMGWEKGDYIAIDYLAKENELVIRNFTAQMRESKR